MIAAVGAIAGVCAGLLSSGSEMDFASRPESARRHPRSPLGAKGTLLLPDGQALSGIFLDISFGGTRVELATAVDPSFLVGKTLAMEIPALEDTSHNKLGKLNGSVLRADRMDDGKVTLGIRFVPATAAKLKLVLSQFRPEKA